MWKLLSSFFVLMCTLMIKTKYHVSKVKKKNLRLYNNVTFQTKTFSIMSKLLSSFFILMCVLMIKIKYYVSKVILMNMCQKFFFFKKTWFLTN